MKRIAFLALVAMVPAALNASPSAARRTLLMPLCTGAANGANAPLPLGPVSPGRDDGQGCCAKGCHAGGSRKRFCRN